MFLLEAMNDFFYQYYPLDSLSSKYNLGLIIKLMTFVNYEILFPVILPILAPDLLTLQDNQYQAYWL
jgi:hypothetical protein